MTTVLHVADDALWKLTLQALADTQHRTTPRVHIRCGCGRSLGALDVVTQGPLFISAWDTPPPDTWKDTGVKVFTSTDGEVDPKQFFADLPHRDYGSETTHGRECVIALIANDLADYPDLLVRCARHGDRILDRHDALDHLRQHPPGTTGTWVVDPQFPRFTDLQVREDGWTDIAGQPRTFKRVTRITGTSGMLPNN